jgi:hypothetical protein
VKHFFGTGVKFLQLPNNYHPSHNFSEWRPMSPATTRRRSPCPIGTASFSISDD